jgi:hypothetical protein
LHARLVERRSCGHDRCNAALAFIAARVRKLPKTYRGHRSEFVRLRAEELGFLGEAECAISGTLQLIENTAAIIGSTRS